VNGTLTTTRPRGRIPAVAGHDGVPPAGCPRRLRHTVGMSEPDLDPEVYPPIDPREPVPDDPGELAPDTPDTLPPAPAEPGPGDPEDPDGVPEPA
jgi:hypothetical protein